MIELKKENIRLLYKAYLLKCLSNNIDEKIDNPPVSYKVFKKQLKKNLVIKLNLYQCLMF